MVAWLAAIGVMSASALAAAGPAKPLEDVTFTKDIAPILQRSCQNCQEKTWEGNMRDDHLRYPTFAGAGAVSLALFVGLASAQEIGGMVTDATGGVLPGVTVEARSPALIEQVRAGITDGNGQYLIIALEPGTYSITYSLPGFGTLVRDEIELSTGFTASIDIELSVGDIAETVTVSGASPVVDIQNVEQRQVINRAIMDSIPTGKTFQAYALLVPGMEGSRPFGTTLSQDSGGLVSQTSRQTLSIHGSRSQDQVTMINGLDVSDTQVEGFVIAMASEGNFQELAIEYSGNSAEVETGGVQLNMIPREGANQFSGGFFGTFALQDLQADNIDQDLRDRGLVSGSKLKESWLVNPSLGGPIIRDRLWFFVGHTTQRADLFAANTFESQDTTSFVYVPDLSRPAFDENLTIEQSLHLTWQATPKDKVKLYWSNDRTDVPHAGQGSRGALFISPEAALHLETGTNKYQAIWVRPQTNRLLFEAAILHMPTKSFTDGAPDAVVTLPGILDVPEIRALRNTSGWLSVETSRNSPRLSNVWRASVSYVTGSHNLKVGTTGYWWRETVIHGSGNNFTSLLTLNGQPLFANFATRGGSTNTANPNIGIYAQEQWTVDRMTVNAGVRFEYLRQSYPDHVILPSAWQPEPFSFPGQTAVTWKDVQPRLGVAYDLLGDGRTALKVSAHRYGAREGTNWATGLNPADANRTQRRFWVDLNGDGFPQGDPRNPAPNGELFSPNPNPAFGQPVITTFYDEAWAFGWGNRFSNWEFSGSVQRELMPSVSLDVGYFRRAFVNFPVRDNRAVGADEFGQYTLLAPADPRVPGGGGNPVTLVDINPAAFGRLPDNITTHVDAFGGESRTWNGVDITVDARLASVLLVGGVSTGKTATDYCSLASQVPEILPGRAGRGDTVPLEFCQANTNWLTQVKLLGSYTLPYDIQVAATYQSVQGPERGATTSFTSQQVEEALGRPLAGGGAVTVDVLEPGTEYGERFHEVDLRFTKIVNLAGVQLRAMFDLYNVFNANAVTNEEYGVGPNYLQPLSIMPGRFVKFSFQFDF